MNNHPRLDLLVFALYIAHPGRQGDRLSGVRSDRHATREDVNGRSAR
jgi:hypothetical protein